MEEKKVAFMGGKPLGVKCLKLLLEQPNTNVVAVVCRSHDAEGWWYPELDKSVFDIVEEHELNRVRESELFDYSLDMAFSVLYYNIISGDLIDHCNECIVNLHPAPLPYYRGSNSYSHAIINNESNYGVTLHLMDTGIDTGPIIKVNWFDLEERITARELHDRSQEEARSLFKKELSSIVRGEFDSTSQEKILNDTNRNHYTYKKESLDPLKEIDLSDIKERPKYVYRLVRGLEFKPFEPAYLFLGGKKVYLKSKPYEDRPSYVFGRTSEVSLDSSKKIKISLLEKKPDYVYDLISNKEFRPFEPPYLFLNGKKVYLKTRPYEVVR